MEIPDHIRNRVGDKCGRLTVLSFEGFREFDSSARQTMWRCVCECGSEVVVQASGLYGGTKSCGCLNREKAAERGRTVLKKANTKHGLSQHPLYDAWQTMVSRCHNPSDKDWDNYGGRGIHVCERWRDVRNYIEDLKERPQGFTLDRIDVNKGYSPENCRWADTRQQGLNTRFNREIPNIYPDGKKWKALFQWKGRGYYVGMYETVEEAKLALENKLMEVGYYG